MQTSDLSSLCCRRFTREPTLLQKVGQVLLSIPTSSTVNSTPKAKPRWLVGKNSFALALPETSNAIYKVLSGDRIDALSSVLGQPAEVDIAAGLESEGLGKLELWMNVFRAILVSWKLQNWFSPCSLCMLLHVVMRL